MHRHPQDRRPVHAEGSVLHDAALRPSGRRPGDLSPEGLGAGGAAEVALARRSAADAQHGTRSPASSARAIAGRCRVSRATDAGPACRCATVLDQAGVKPQAREFVFFGADHGEEEVEFRTTEYKVEQQFGRSLSREKALSPEPFLAYALNGEPLTRHQGSPLRLLVPGLVRRRQREMAVGDSRAGRASTSASSRPAGTARCGAR